MPRWCALCGEAYLGSGRCVGEAVRANDEPCPRRLGWTRASVAAALSQGRVVPGLWVDSPLHAPGPPVRWAGNGRSVFLPPGWQLWVCTRTHRVFYAAAGDRGRPSQWHRPSDDDAVWPSRVPGPRGDEPPPRQPESEPGPTLG